MGQTFSLKEIVKTAQEKSPFFKKLYASINFDKFTSDDELLKSLPLTNHTDFWSQHSYEKNPLITEPFPHGMLFKSGGSTGKPKFSYFSQSEWDSFTEHFGWGISQGILKENDRVANLFYAGDLYASFLFIHDSLDSVPFKFIQFPLGGGIPPETMEKHIEELNINVLCGVPTSITHLFQYLDQKKSPALKKIEKILYGGESMYEDQKIWLRSVIPNLQISSVGIASVDGGLVGYCSTDCGPDEHRAFDRATIMEILDEETLKPIEDLNRSGKLYLTNLTRKLMPIVRYPVGDKALWLEPLGTKNRKFKVLGRSEEGARVGTVTVFFEDVQKILHEVFSADVGAQFQMVLKHFDQKDELTLEISCQKSIENTEALKKKIQQKFHEQKPTFLEALKKDLLHPLNVHFTSQLEQNQRTGKLKRIIDHRK